MSKALSVVAGAAILVIALMLSVTVVDTLQQGETGLEERVVRDDVRLSGAGTWVSVADGKGTNETVYKTTGYAVNLTGADDSFVESNKEFQIASDKNWTVSVWGYVDPAAANDNMTLLSLDGRLIISYNGSSGNWSAWLYEEGDRDSWVVNVSTSGNEAGNLTNIIVKHNETNLTIYRNNTRGELQSVTGDNIADAPVNDTNWNGRIEEVRTFDEALDSTNRSELVNSPVEGQPDVDRTSRIMFDQPNKATQVIIFTDAKLKTSNVTFSNGFAEQVMQGPSATNDILSQTDYDWEAEGPRIRPLANDELDGEPIVYITYDFDDSLAQVYTDWADVVSIAALIPIIAIGALIFARLKGLE